MAVTPRYGALLDALRGLAWPARRPSRGAAAGTHQSRLRGQSAEFTEYRGYRQGDDPRRLDWKLLARTDRAYLRITNERATLPTLIAVDASASMRFPEGTETKWAQARTVAVGLAGVAHAAGDPVALVVTGSPPRRLPFRARRGVVSEVARTLDGISVGGDADLTASLIDPGGVARLVLITDLLGDGPALLRLARDRVARGLDVVAVHVVAREELEPPGDPVLAFDPERPELRRTLSAATRVSYRSAFDAWRAESSRAWRSAGARYVEVITDEPAERAVRRIVGTAGEGIDG